MTKQQREALETIRANGGYAFKWSGGGLGTWGCAVFVDGPAAHFQRGAPSLSARVMDRLKRDGIIRFAPGHGYGCTSFWEIVPEADQVG